jgi:hypothetical protein
VHEIVDDLVGCVRLQEDLISDVPSDHLDTGLRSDAFVPRRSQLHLAKNEKALENVNEGTDGIRTGNPIDLTAFDAGERVTSIVDKPTNFISGQGIVLISAFGKKVGCYCQMSKVPRITKMSRRFLEGLGIVFEILSYPVGYIVVIIGHP